MSKRKNRGIRCSRLKLDAALASSDIPKKTQIALAEAIADVEGLDSVPKDLVSKIFRELPVDSQTIERVASVLGVSASSLYLEEKEVPATGNEKESYFSLNQKSEIESQIELNQTSKTTKVLAKQEIKPVKALILSFAMLMVVSICVVFFFEPFQSTQENCFISRSLQQSSLSQDNISIVVARLSGDQQNQGQLMLATKLASDQRLQGRTQIFTSCLSIPIKANTSVREQIVNGHDAARRELNLYNAHLIIWGERYGDRVNLRFTSRGSANQLKRLRLAGKTIQTNERDFDFNIRLDDSESLSGDLQLVILNMISAQTDKELALKNELINQYNYSGSWLKEAVVSDSNLLRRISMKSDPKLYELTLSQLCFRRRLLGDFESSDEEYLLAADACNKALEVINKKDAPMQWASIKGNLATLTTRRQLFAKSIEERLEILKSARTQFEQIEAVYQSLASNSEAATYYQNFAAVYIRLAEIETVKAVNLLEKAKELSAKSIALSRVEDNPLYYALRLQNQCMLKYRLGSIQKNEGLLESATKDCAEALEHITTKEHPAESAMIWNNLAVSYAILAEIKQLPELFNQALNSFDKAQTIYTKVEFPLNWGEVEINKAELKCKLALLTYDKNIMDDARSSADSALLIFIQKDIKPYQDYANNLISKTLKCKSTDISDCQCSS